MREIDNVYIGDWIANENLRVSGLLNGNLVINAGAEVEILGGGIVNGNILVNAGGKLLLQGDVKNGITNMGGNVNIYGTVKGGLKDLSGNAFIAKGASVS